MKKQEELENFGKTIINSVRDSTYRQYEKIANGDLKSRSAKLLQEKLGKFDDEQIETLKMIVRDTIDSTLHHFLFMIEQNEEYDLIKYIDDNSQFVSLREISDGLCGELYTEDGWIEKYSKYPPSIK